VDSEAEAAARAGGKQRTAVGMGMSNNEEQAMLRLRRYNLAMGALHAAQGIFILALSNSFSLPAVNSQSSDMDPKN
jgi:hypothetical protein